jgi:hypothetical protein
MKPARMLNGPRHCRVPGMVGLVVLGSFVSHPRETVYVPFVVC